ncbi:MAG: hypothetical protein K2G56_00760 [Eubacterium sp.]|nr:hypothetical protein [Eubacterium sp.]
MDNLNDIIASLSSDDINMLKGVASSILGEEASGVENNLPAKEPAPQNALSSLGFSGDDFSMIMKAKSMFDRMNKTSNKNTDLIMALKPHLSPENRNKADTAIRILKMFEILPLLKDLF